MIIYEKNIQKIENANIFVKTFRTFAKIMIEMILVLVAQDANVHLLYV
jgi:hypothetical protein